MKREQQPAEESGCVHDLCGGVWQGVGVCGGVWRGVEWRGGMWECVAWCGGVSGSGVGVLLWFAVWV